MDENKKCNDSQLEWHCLNSFQDHKCDNTCKVQRILDLFGKKNTLSILRLLLLEDKLRFNELLKKLGGSPKTLTSRLKELEQFGLLKRELFNEIPIRVEYSLTEAGKNLEQIFERISIWSKKWL
jgi:DNA-binding HxlR family transcriptional regulator